jgi:transcriptional regulator with XRE-family HTH domain
MTLTTGALLRRIIETPLSASAHKLATIILDGIAWKDGYNGLERGTAAFTLADMARKMGVSRQHLSDLLSELARSTLALARWKSNGKFAPWIFRFAGLEEDTPQNVASATDDTSLYRESKNKTVFAGRIELGAESDVYRTPWANRIKAAKSALLCWNVDSQVIWERFLAFNRARGNDKVPAGFLLGFMRRWRTSQGAATQPQETPAPQTAQDPLERELHEQIKAAPSSNRQFHASDLCRVIGQAAYDARVVDVIRQFGCPRFTATLAVHGRAVLAGEIAR